MPPAWLRPVLWLSSTRSGGWFFANVWPVVDRSLLRLSGGRFSISGLAIPTLLLTTRGRRSGALRETPLLYIPAAGDPGKDDAHRPLIVAGSRGGGSRHAGWYYNLTAHPAAQVTIAGRQRVHTAQVLDGAERSQQWQRLCAVHPGFERYEARVSREIPVIRLDPAGADTVV